MSQLPLTAWPKQYFGGFWRRYAAYLIDSLLIWAITRLLFNLTLHHWISVDLAQDLWWYKGLKLTIFLAYFAVTNYLLKGQTIGKYLLDLKVVSSQTGQFNLQTSLVREIAGRYLLYRFPLLTLVLIFTPRRQHLFDLLCDTVVVDTIQVDYYQQAQNQELLVPEQLLTKPASHQE